MPNNRPSWLIAALLLATTAGCSLALFDDPPRPDAADSTGEGGADADAPDAEADIPPGCGNGTEEPGEQCDDGNRIDGDGCDNDCTWSCSVDAQCRDSDICNGSETCDTASHFCNPGTDAPNGTECTQPSGDPGQCRTGVCRPLTCGNGTVDLDQGEECDDGDDDDSDRCPSTCLWATCGDGFTWNSDGGEEECDDGNTFDEDGCDSDCTWSCSAAADCDDQEPCNGTETCGAEHQCVPGDALPDGERCTTGMGEPGTCQAAICTPEGCGDGTWSPPGEACDDGNRDAGDGCEPNCQPTCSRNADCYESPDDPCTNDACSVADATTGARTCSHTPHTGLCDDGLACTEHDRCDAEGHCAGVPIDADRDTHGMAPCGDDCNDSDSNIHPDVLDPCNGVDDDCDTATDEDFAGGARCDGTDADRCEDGTTSCIAGSIACSDDPASRIETCGATDDDCDTATDEDIWCPWVNISSTWFNGVWVDGTDDVGFAVGYTTVSPTHPTIAQWNRARGTWETMFTDVSVNTEVLHGVWGRGTTNARSVGTTALAYGYAGSSWTSSTVPWRSDSTTMYDIWGAPGSPITYWVVGAGGAAYFWDGYNWMNRSASAVTSGRSLGGVCGLDANTVWAVGGTDATLSSTIIRWNSGTSTWNREGVPTTGIELNDCWAVDGDNVYAVGAAGTILHGNSAGAWTIDSSGTTATLWGVWGAPGTPVFAVGDSGTILRRAGTTWIRDISGTAARFNAIHGRGGSAPIAVVVTDRGDVYRWHP